MPFFEERRAHFTDYWDWPYVRSLIVRIRQEVEHGRFDDDLLSPKEQLIRYYNRAWTFLKERLSAYKMVSLPLLVLPSDSYLSAKFKWLIVGQETNQWAGYADEGDAESQIEKSFEAYKQFNLGEKYRRSPFWQAARQLQEKLSPEPDVYPQNFLWSNLFLCDQGAQRPKPPASDILLE
jgi:hypothetical protein